MSIADYTKFVPPDTGNDDVVEITAPLSDVRALVGYAIEQEQRAESLERKVRDLRELLREYDARVTEYEKLLEGR